MLWVIGGYDGTKQDDVWRSHDGIEWSLVTDDAAFSGRDGGQRVFFEHRMWMLGGHDGSYKGDVWSSP